MDSPKWQSIKKELELCNVYALARPKLGKMQDFTTTENTELTEKDQDFIQHSTLKRHMKFCCTILIENLKDLAAGERSRECASVHIL